MTPGGEIFAHQTENARLDAGKSPGQFNDIGNAVGTAFFNGFIFPGDAEEVQRGKLLHSHIFQLSFDAFGDQLRIFELRDSRQDDIIFPCLPDIPCQNFFINGKVDHKNLCPLNFKYIFQIIYTAFALLANNFSLQP